MAESVETRIAAWGERMIEVKVRFWTNGMAREKGQIRPKHAWTSGVIRIERNEVHGIKPKPPVPFNSLMAIPTVIEQVLIENGVALHLDHNMSKYIQK